MGKEKEKYNKHYSDTRGHKERSNFWKAVRAICQGREVDHKAAVVEYIARRYPLKVPKDGK